MLIIIPYFLLELYFSLAVGSKIGFLGSVIWIVITFIIGMGLLKNAHLSFLNGFNSLSSGKLNLDTFHNSATSYFLGAILLIIPGVFSDFLGVILLIYSLFLQMGGIISYKDNKLNKSDKKNSDDIIDVEIIDYRR